ncbi:hypothetical protein AB0O47_32700 [Streptomyces noursei]|uniref:hypothetical protein n=1 Tax=Streptomyces noursei TaxID=1971 RepID=UPI00344B0513
MAGRVRRCAHVFCNQPLPARSRSDRRYCSAAHKAAERRWRHRYVEAVGIGIAIICGEEDEHVVRCPVCGVRFTLGHGHRRDSIYDGPACRQAAYRARRAERVREAVTGPSMVTDPETHCETLTSTNREGE